MADRGREREAVPEQPVVEGQFGGGTPKARKAAKERERSRSRTRSPSKRGKSQEPREPEDAQAREHALVRDARERGASIPRKPRNPKKPKKKKDTFTPRQDVSQRMSTEEAERIDKRMARFLAKKAARTAAQQEEEGLDEEIARKTQMLEDSPQPVTDTPVLLTDIRVTPEPIVHESPVAPTPILEDVPVPQQLAVDQCTRLEEELQRCRVARFDLTLRVNTALSGIEGALTAIHDPQNVLGHVLGLFKELKTQWEDDDLVETVESELGRVGRQRDLAAAVISSAKLLQKANRGSDAANMFTMREIENVLRGTAQAKDSIEHAHRVLNTLNSWYPALFGQLNEELRRMEVARQNDHIDLEQALASAQGRTPPATPDVSPLPPLSPAEPTLIGQQLFPPTRVHAKKKQDELGVKALKSELSKAEKKLLATMTSVIVSGGLLEQGTSVFSIAAIIMTLPRTSGHPIMAPLGRGATADQAAAYEEELKENLIALLETVKGLAEAASEMVVEDDRDVEWGERWRWMVAQYVHAAVLTGDINSDNRPPSAVRSLREAMPSLLPDVARNTLFECTATKLYEYVTARLSKSQITPETLAQMHNIRAGGSFDAPPDVEEGADIDQVFRDANVSASNSPVPRDLHDEDLASALGAVFSPVPAVHMDSE